MSAPPYRFPFPPFPTAWYCVGTSAELQPGALRQITFCGQERVLYRTAAGVPALVDAFCPHLGAHFAHGGKVEGERLRCPFHDFSFDTAGVCVHIPGGGKPPPAAKMVSVPLREQNGLLLAWFDSAGRAPSFEVPILDDRGWTPIVTHTWRLRTHPQETAENSVDIAHFHSVHKYDDVAVLADLELDGPVLRSRYAFTRNENFLIGPSKVRVEFDAVIHGLGYSIVHARTLSLKTHTRHWVLPTPIDGEHIDLHVGLSVQEFEDPNVILQGLGLLPRGWLTRQAVGPTMAGYVHDVSQDIAIWENKRYIHPPALASTDGPIGKYRAWCRQFYPELA